MSEREVSILECVEGGFLVVFRAYSTRSAAKHAG